MNVFAVLLLVGVAAAQEPEQQWPQWRGPLGTGEAPGADPPLKWSEEKNVRWKTAIPGRGHSTPVVWGDAIYLTTAIPFGDTREPKPDPDPGAHDNLPVKRRHRYVVLAVNRSDGKILWQTIVHENLPHEGGHTSGSLASASPVTDGKRVIAFFGSNGLYCLGTDGTIVWKKDLGDQRTKHNHGEGASPALHDGTVVVNWDHEGDSFVVAIEASTGKERWRVARDEVTSWATPIVLEHGGVKQVIVNGTTRLRSYDLATGKVLWQCGGMSNNVVASPVHGDGVLIAGSSYEKQAMVAIRLEGAKGEVTGTDRVAWTRDRRTPYVPSLLLYRGFVYYLHHYQPILSRVDAKTGAETSGPFRLPDVRGMYASPVAAAGRIYFTDLQGRTLVISADPEPKPLVVNRLDDQFSASVALVGREIFMRGAKSLYCIAEEK